MAEDLYLPATIVLMLGMLTVIGTLISDILLVFFDPESKSKTSRNIVFYWLDGRKKRELPKE